MLFLEEIIDCVNCYIKGEMLQWPSFLHLWIPGNKCVSRSWQFESPSVPDMEKLLTVKSFGPSEGFIAGSLEVCSALETEVSVLWKEFGLCQEEVIDIIRCKM